ncbi:MAG TPA: hypothetical protein VLA34_05380, partial [Candidatus Krumholzibacterium sp.]|nr:hypothetical protein [Candidatus Krumholzibacterium sp.]
MALDSIVIRGARQHNLRDLDLEIPHRKIIAVTGVSGSGKSSLAFDTIYAEGQRRYIESLSTYARQFIEKLDRPDLDSISGISPTIAIRQKNTVTSARSTVGTATEIYDYLRLLFSRAGRLKCPDCRIDVRAWQPSDVAEDVIRLFGGDRVYILMEEEPLDPSSWDARRAYLTSRGYSRLLADGGSVRIDEFQSAAMTGKVFHVMLDRVEAVERNRTRIAEAVEQAYREHAGTVDVMDASSGESARYCSEPSCPGCGRTFEKLSPLLFSFNSPYGACPDCKGFGDRMEFSEDMIVPDRTRSISEKAVDPWSRERFEFFHHKMVDFCKGNDIPLDVPWRDLPQDTRFLLLDGRGDYPGVIPFLEKMKEKNYKKGHRFFTRRYMGFSRCRTCRGSRLRKEAGYVTFAGRTIHELVSMVPSRIIEVIDGADLNERQTAISRDLI